MQSNTMKAVKSDEQERLHPLPFWKGRGFGSGLRPPLRKRGTGESKKLRYNMPIVPPRILTSHYNFSIIQFHYCPNKIRTVVNEYLL